MSQEPNPVFTDYPNPKSNAFMMMRFRDTPQNREIVSVIQQTLKHYGINLLRADQKTYEDSLWANVKAYMDACELGVAVFEQIDDQDFNPNISLELGYMLAKSRKILLLKESRLKNLPTDIVGQLYKPFDVFHIPETIRLRVQEWLRDVGVAKSPAERLVLFISHGGTCRCAMAKVATKQALKGRNLPYKLRIESVAYEFGGGSEASKGARMAVQESYGNDYLQSHKVTVRNLGLIEDADLILVMQDSLRAGLPEEKVFNFNSFFGLSGDVEDPWRPGDEDDETLMKRYRPCLQHVRGVIDNHVDKIISYLSTH
jgi:protein-tyrosine-phosphatase